MSNALKRAEEAELLAHNLLLFAGELRNSASGGAEVHLFPDRSDWMLSTARRAYQARRKRDDHFPGEIFGEPAWDMLLDLYVAFVSERDINVTSVCLGSHVPNSTALRWLET